MIMQNPDATDLLRVSIATYNQVTFPHPDDGTVMLALERRASVKDDGHVHVRAQPYGGGVRILNAAPLQRVIGKLQFDSERSRQEQDFRILIPPSKWELIKEYCLHHLQDEEDAELETEPDRELTEEFLETMNLRLTPRQFIVRPMGFVIENNPVRTTNEYARAQLTVRLYRIFKIEITDPILGRVMLGISHLYSDQDLGARALRDFEDGGQGRANTILTLPFASVQESYRALAPEQRYRKLHIESHELEESVLAILWDIEVPQYQRL